MLFYIKCPSCSRIIGKNLDKYSTELEEIQINPTLTKVEKQELASKLLDKYNYTEICCRSRIMGLIPYHKIISS